ncbi:hypothetical protein EJ03DRAFT_97034 [Teratosphaeria nubilosa]|uniref:Uncharacterized protein n=1 Tax=Teratosphaeria nubilosa TaxID=161662 RepID=A0A6G1L914_9PEZI|nr:hypothetical protein EJ03DRAFT_97034 [Teratosphaeria nubilosa]
MVRCLKQLSTASSSSQPYRAWTIGNLPTPSQVISRYIPPFAASTVAYTAARLNTRSHPPIVQLIQRQRIMLVLARLIWSRQHLFLADTITPLVGLRFLVRATGSWTAASADDFVSLVLRIFLCSPLEFVHGVCKVNSRSDLEGLLDLTMS